MTTYRELIARRDDFEFMSVSWKGVNSLIQEYLRAKIFAGHMEFARMVIGDLCDATESGAYDNDSYFKSMYDEWISWFKFWGYSEQADELADFVNEPA